MGKILKKAEIIDNLADSVTIVMLIQGKENFIVKACAFSPKGDILIYEFENIYSTYVSAFEKYSKLIIAH